MRSLQEFASDLERVLAHLDAEHLVIVGELYTAVLIQRGVLHAPRILRAVAELRALAPTMPAPAAEIFSADCGLPPPV